MKKRVKFLLAGLAVIGLASPAAARWKGGDTVYPTLGECFAKNFSCKYIGNLVRVANAASLTRANEELRASRKRNGAEILYYAVASEKLSRRVVDNTALPTGTNDGVVFGCLTTSGTVNKGHYGKCAKDEVPINVME